MKNVRQKLIDRIALDIPELRFKPDLTTEIHRPTLSWQHKTAGRLVWYWYIDGNTIGSSELMTTLLKSKNKLVLYQAAHGVYEISSS